ncbi:transporter substrate-binding domain-containing protein [Bowmanella sp. Y26]|uniref:substrate-binding periplasmic protein n=1 Tax=Bowmanella yangjiangensis TaxID=2811230 RepID=UPI001BDD5DB6|nr:transporter substrate-binding domain-containing protein [Bowmanella yangjiangensis]MBT1064286.1 transporter substrate-binding domain-containing protein [Bowmanella yangjiangensis]
MKRMLILLSLISSHAYSETFCQQPIRIVFSGDWYPYFYQDKQGQYTGVDIDLLRQALNNMGCKLNIMHLPERRITNDLLSGRIDVAIAATETEERQAQFILSVPYRQQTNVLVYRKADKRTSALNTVSEMVQQNKLIALNRGGWFGPEVAGILDSKWARQLMHVETFASRLELLRRGRVDAFIDDQETVLAEIDRLHLNDLCIIPRPVDVADQHYMFSKMHLDDRFISEFNRQLSQLLPNLPEATTPAATAHLD